MHRFGQLRVGMAHPCTLLRAGRTWHHALFPSRSTGPLHQVHRSDRRDGTHPTPRTLPAMRNSTVMQTVRSASCLSTCNHVRRATLITAPGALLMPWADLPAALLLGLAPGHALPSASAAGADLGSSAPAAEPVGAGTAPTRQWRTTFRSQRRRNGQGRGRCAPPLPAAYTGSAAARDKCRRSSCLCRCMHVWCPADKAGWLGSQL